MNETDAQGQLFYHKPSGKRSCTDFLCTILFLAGWGGIIYLLLYVRTKGAEPNYVVRAVDYRGRICGVDDGVKSRPFGAWPNPLEYQFKVCVSDCGITSGGSSANATLSDRLFFAASYTSKPVLFYCLPAFNGTIGLSVSGDFSDYANTAARSIGDLYTVWPVILASGFFALLLSFLYASLQKCCAKLLVFIGMFLVLGGTAMGAYVLLKMAQNAKDNGTFDGSYTYQAMQVGGWTLVALDIIAFFIIIALWDRIMIAIQLVIAAGKAVAEMPCIVLFPINSFIWAILYLAFWILGAVLIWSVKTKTFESVPSYFDTAARLDVGTSYSGNFTVLSFNQDLRYSFAALIFHGLWNLQFIVYFTYLTIAGAATQWYFSVPEGGSKKRSGCRQETGKLQSWPVFASCCRTTWNHTGSVAFGALIIAIIVMIRIIVKYIERQTSSKKPNCLQRIIFCVIDCCLACLQCCIDKISKNAFIWQALWGSGFIDSAITSFSLVWANLGRALAVSIVGAYLMMIGRLMVASCSAGAMGLVIMHVYKFELNSSIMPMVIMFLISFIIASMFMVIYETMIDSLFICFLVDELRKNKDANLIFVPGLHERIHATSKEFEDDERSQKDIAANRVARRHGDNDTPGSHRVLACVNCSQKYEAYPTCPKFCSNCQEPLRPSEDQIKGIRDRENAQSSASCCGCGQ